MDLECADGLWNWESTGLTRPPTWNPNGTVSVYKRSTVSYNNDAPNISSSLLNRDDISFVYSNKTIWHTQQS